MRNGGASHERPSMRKKKSLRIDPSLRLGQQPTARRWTASFTKKTAPDGNHDESTMHTRFVTPLEYAATVSQNREIFLLNFSKDFRRFDGLLNELQTVSLRVTRERDSKGASHVSLLVPLGILIRHCMFGFQQLVSYQSFLAWLAFRPGLEALLIMGKWIEDPNTARIWSERDTEPGRYQRTFSGRALLSRSLSRSAEFRRVLGRLNDEFVHPNPYFAFRETSLREASAETMVVETRFFDDRPELHEAHLLAYLHLLDLMVTTCDGLFTKLFGAREASVGAARPTVAADEGERAKSLAQRHPLAKKIMEELGLWQF